jgi:hypothetical protein
MAQFADRKAVTAWLNAHKGRAVRLTSPGTRLRVVGTTQGIEELDACSTDIFYAELRTALPGLQIALTLHDEEVSLHLLAQDPKGGPAPVSLPLSFPYDRLRLDPAEAPEHGRPAAKEEPEFSPYELLRYPRS